MEALNKIRYIYATDRKGGLKYVKFFKKKVSYRTECCLYLYIYVCIEVLLKLNCNELLKQRWLAAHQNVTDPLPYGSFTTERQLPSQGLNLPPTSLPSVMVM